MSTRLFVGGLPDDLDHEWIKSRFNAISIHIPSPNPQSSRHFAFVEVPADHVPIIIKKFHKTKFRGMQLRVEIAKPDWFQQMKSQEIIPVDSSSDCNQKNAEAGCLGGIIKIRVGRKRAIEDLDRSHNPRHMKFSDNHVQHDRKRNESLADLHEIIDNCEQRERKEKSTQLPFHAIRSLKPLKAPSKCNNRVKVASPSNDTMLGSLFTSDNMKIFRWDSKQSNEQTQSFDIEASSNTELNESSFLLGAKSSMAESGSVSIDDVSKPRPTISRSSKKTKKKEKKIPIDDDSLEGSKSVDFGQRNSDELSRGPKSESHVTRDDCDHGGNMSHDLTESNDMQEILAVLHQREMDNTNEVVDEIRKDNSAKLAVFKSMFGGEMETSKETIIWNKQIRYDPTNTFQEIDKPETNDRNTQILKESTISEQQDSVSAGVDLVSNWSSLWRRSNSNFDQSVPEKFTLLNDDPMLVGESIPEPDNSSVHSHLIHLPELRPSFLQCLATELQSSQECFLFRRSSPAAELIAACREARTRRIHSYKKHIKEHAHMGHYRRKINK